MEGGIFGRYRVQRRIGAGGMGEVYAATHELMKREAVIKLLLPEFSNHETVVRRFFQEARAAAQVEHPGIVEVFDFGYADDGRAYIVMEMLRGEPLSKRLESTPVLPLDQAMRLIRQLAGAVGAAHERGIIHRDLKPDNIFIVPDPEVQGGERIKVLDFGLAKLALPGTRSLVTMNGSVFGTPAYMAPEQCTNAATVDHRADLYSIGCILYRCLCGRTPFGGASVDVLAAQLYAPVLPPRQVQPSIPASIDALILKLLHKEPAQRFQSCRELIDALDGKQAARPVTPPAARPMAVVSLPARDARPALLAQETMKLRPHRPDDAPVQQAREADDTDRVHTPAGLHEAPTMHLDRDPAVSPVFTGGPMDDTRRLAAQLLPASAGAGDNATIVLDGPIEELAKAPDNATIVLDGPIEELAKAPDNATIVFDGPIEELANPAGGNIGTPAHESESLRRSSLSMAGMGELYTQPLRMPERARRRWWLMGGGMAAAGLVLVAVVTLLGQDGAGAREQTSTSARAAEFEAFDLHMTRAEQAAAAEQWDSVPAAIEQAMRQPPDDQARIERARALQERARREQSGQHALARFLEARPRQDPTEDQIEAALQHYAQIPRDSGAYAEAERAYIELRDTWLEHVRDQAAPLIDKGACDPLDAHIMDTGRLFPELPPEPLDELAALSQKCTTRAERRQARARARAEREEASASSAPLDGPQRFQAILRATQQGQYGEVTQLCTAGIGNVPEPVRAATLCGLAACRTGRASQAKYYHRKLPSDLQSSVVQTCLQHGIDLVSRPK